jgi:hypothetical protein
MVYHVIPYETTILETNEMFGLSIEHGTRTFLEKKMSHVAGDVRGGYYDCEGPKLSNDNRRTTRLLETYSIFI